MRVKVGSPGTAREGEEKSPAIAITGLATGAGHMAAPTLGLVNAGKVHLQNLQVHT